MKRGPRKADVSKRLGRKWDALAQGAPELLNDTDFAHPYIAPKPRAPVKQSEKTEVQRPLVVYLRRHLPEGSIVFAVPNQARSKAQRFSLVRDGLLPGVPDLCIITTRTTMLCGDDEDHSMIPHTTPWVGFIENKAPDGGKLSDAQIHVQEQIRQLGLPVLSECRSIEQAVAWLHSHGVAIR